MISNNLFTAAASHNAASSLTSAHVAGGNAMSSQLSVEHPMSLATVICCIPASYNVISLPAYLPTQAWTVGR